MHWFRQNMTRKQDYLDNMQEVEIYITPKTTNSQIYPKYVMPLAIRHFSGPCRIGPTPGVNGILYVHEGTIRTESGGPSITAPILAPIDRISIADEKTEGWLITYLPVAINQNFAASPELSSELENDPYMKRDRELLESILPSRDHADNRCMILTPEEDQFVLRMFSSLTDLLEGQKDVYWPCRSRSFFLEILLFFWQRPAPAAMPAERSKARRIHDWLRVHYPEKISLETLSKEFGSNRTTLQEQFRREYGSSIMDVLGQIRVEAATILMRNTQLSLAEIGFRTGFGDYSNFYREFQRRKHASPHDWRTQVATVRIY